MNLISTKLDIEHAVRAYYRPATAGSVSGMTRSANTAWTRLVGLLREVPIKVTHLVYAGPFNQTSEKDYLAAREDDREKLR